MLEPAPVAHFCQNKFRRTEGRAHPAKQILVLRDVDVCFPVEIDSIIAIAVYKACNIRDKNCDEAGARALRESARILVVVLDGDDGLLPGAMGGGNDLLDFRVR